MKITQETLDRYYEGRCTAGEQAAVERWLADGTELPEIPDLPRLQELEDRAWKRLREEHIRSRTPIRTKKRRLPVWALAACMAAAATCGILLYRTAGGDHTNINQRQSAAAAYREYRTKPGQKARVTLPDGSTVYLNADSRLRYPAQFTGGRREVTLEGEGYFSVVSLADKPFTVLSGETRIRVLGTKFNVRAYSDHGRTELVLAEGRVIFSAGSGRDSIMLQRGQRAIANGSTGPLMVDRVDPAKHTAWKDNRLWFDGALLSEVITELERWYGVAIRVDDRRLLGERYTGRFDNPSLHRVLESLSYAIKFRYEQQGNQFRIYR